MSGLGTLPDAPAVAQMVIAATGESPSDLRIVGQGITAVAWRVEVDAAVEGGAYCVLIGLPSHGTESEWPGAGGQIEARAGVMTALRERDGRCPEVFGTSLSEGAPERLRRWSWMVTSWMRGAPLEDAEDAGGMTAEIAREVGGVLALLHAIPVTGHGMLADTAEELRGASDVPGTDLTSRWGQELWPFDGRPLTAHPVMQAAPQLALPVGALREQLLAYADQGARVVCHAGLSPEHIWVEQGRLTGLIDFGDAAVLPPAWDIASFAYEFGWEMAGALLEGYSPNSVLRDIRRAEAYHLAVLMALEDVERWTLRPKAEDLADAVAFLEKTLPRAVRRMDA